MLSQGWKAGEGLGARNRHGFDSYDNAKLKVSFKDDNLGLGASLKSKNVEHSRTGLDAFQGLLGRLNGKSDAEIEAVEKKEEERKLAMFAQGKWGMVFVPGGLLVQRDDFKVNSEQTEEQREFKAMRNDAEAILKAKRRQKGGMDAEGVPSEDDEAAAKARRKHERAEKRQRKEDRRRRKAEKAAGDAGASIEVSANEASKKDRKKKKEALPMPPKETSAPDTDASDARDAVPIPAPSRARPVVRNGRQLLRGRNIAAKKSAFADSKMLDEIFMRKT